MAEKQTETISVELPDIALPGGSESRRIIELLGELAEVLEQYAAIDGAPPKSNTIAGAQTIWRPIGLLASEFAPMFPPGSSVCATRPGEDAYKLAGEALELISQGLGLGGFLPLAQEEGIKLRYPPHVAASTIADLRRAAELLMSVGPPECGNGPA